MQKSVLIHIGLHKTGSTSIQDALSDLRKLRQLGTACYPLPGTPSHNRVPALYLPHDRLPRYDRTCFPADDQSFADHKSRLARDFLSELGDAQAAVISAENLSLLEASEIARLKQDLVSCGYERFRVLVYIRNPASQYLSEVQQRLKASAVVPDPRGYRHRFRSIIESWESVFPGDLRPHAFPGSETGNNVVSDFLHTLGEFLGLRLASSSSYRSNASVSAEGMLVLERYQRAFSQGQDDVFTSDKMRLVRLLEESKADVPQSAPSLRGEIAHLINANHCEDVQWLSRRYNMDLGCGDGQSSVPSVRVEGGAVSSIRELLCECDGDATERLLLWLLNRALK